MTIIINSILFFHSINLHLVSRTVNLQEGIFKRVKLGKKSFWTFSYDFFVQFGEFVQLDVACPIKPKQTAQTWALSSTASEARSINLGRPVSYTHLTLPTIYSVLGAVGPRAAAAPVALPLEIDGSRL